MLLKYENVYYPYGKWVTAGGETVTVESNFRCLYNDIHLICILIKTKTPPGHGEGSLEGVVPIYISEATLMPVDVNGFVQV